jgi:hypothetical protein
MEVKPKIEYTDKNIIVWKPVKIFIKLIPSTRQSGFLYSNSNFCSNLVSDIVYSTNDKIVLLGFIPYF